MIMEKLPKFTYEEILKKIKEEKSNRKIIELDSRWYNFIKEILQKNTVEETSLDSKIKNLELKLTKALIHALIEIRLKKIQDFIKSYPFSNFLDNIQSFETKLIKKQPENLSLITIISKEDIPDFYTEEGYRIGPLKYNDIVFISENLSSILIKKKLAKKIGE